MKNFKPILFSTAMVQAILEGRKTQTRRVIKPQPSLINDNVHFNFNGDYYLTRKQMLEKAPIQPGTILWVRETTRVGAWNEYENQIAFDYKASPEIVRTPWCEISHQAFGKELTKILAQLEAKGVKANKYGHYVWEHGKSPLPWKPSIFMPKEACRIFLEITNVRVERLQDISEEDAKAEGIQFYFEELFQENRYRDYNKKLQAGYGDPAVDYPTWRDPISSFKSLWQFINGWESWDKNQWVWVYDFKRVEKPENFLS